MTCTPSSSIRQQCWRFASLAIIPSSTETSALAWTCLTMFCTFNGRQLQVPTEEAVTTMQSVAAGDLDEAGLAQWLAVWVDRNV